MLNVHSPSRLARSRPDRSPDDERQHGTTREGVRSSGRPKVQLAIRTGARALRVQSNGHTEKRQRRTKLNLPAYSFLLGISNLKLRCSPGARRLFPTTSWKYVPRTFPLASKIVSAIVAFFTPLSP